MVFFMLAKYCDDSVLFMVYFMYVIIYGQIDSFPYMILATSKRKVTDSVFPLKC